MSAWALWLLTVLALPVVPLLDRLLRQAGRADLVQLTPGTAFPVVAMVSGATVGAVLAGRRPRHPVGWLLLAVALTLAATAAAAQYLTWGLRLLGRGSSLVVAAATLAVAAAFQPARRRVQAAVDRRFNRRRHDAGRVIEVFGARLRDQVDLTTLITEVMAVVDQTMQPTTAWLWLRPGQGGPGPAGSPWPQPGTR